MWCSCKSKFVWWYYCLPIYSDVLLQVVFDNTHRCNTDVYPFFCVLAYLICCSFFACSAGPRYGAAGLSGVSCHGIEPLLGSCSFRVSGSCTEMNVRAGVSCTASGRYHAAVFDVVIRDCFALVVSFIFQGFPRAAFDFILTRAFQAPMISMWRSCIMAVGAQYAIVVGTLLMEAWCVKNLVWVLQPLILLHPSGKHNCIHRFSKLH